MRQSHLNAKGFMNDLNIYGWETYKELSGTLFSRLDSRFKASPGQQGFQPSFSVGSDFLIGQCD